MNQAYTGKALAALVADARAGKLAGKTVLFWNTHSSRQVAGKTSNAVGASGAGFSDVTNGGALKDMPPR